MASQHFSSAGRSKRNELEFTIPIGYQLHTSLTMSGTRKSTSPKGVSKKERTDEQRFRDMMRQRACRARKAARAAAAAADEAAYAEI